MIMKLKLTVLFAAAILIFIASNSFAQKVYSPADAKDHINDTLTVKGVVSQVSVTRGGQVYFNMGGRYPDNVFSAVILKPNADKFADVKEYEGKTVLVTGKVKMYNGKPEILLEKKEQLSLAPAEEIKK